MRENFVTLKVSEICKMENMLRKKTRLEKNKIQNLLKATALNAEYNKHSKDTE